MWGMATGAAWIAAITIDCHDADAQRRFYREALVGTDMARRRQVGRSLSYADPHPGLGSGNPVCGAGWTNCPICGASLALSSASQPLPWALITDEAGPEALLRPK